MAAAFPEACDLKSSFKVDRCGLRFLAVSSGVGGGRPTRRRGLWKKRWCRGRRYRRSPGATAFQQVSCSLGADKRERARLHLRSRRVLPLCGSLGPDTGAEISKPSSEELTQSTKALSSIPRAPKAHCASPGCDLIRRSNCPTVLAPSTTDAHYEPSREKREDQYRQQNPSGAPCQTVGTFFACSVACGIRPERVDRDQSRRRQAGAG
jgi:hypothetical protein